MTVRLSLPSKSFLGGVPCKYGAGCTNFDDEHRKTYSHPEGVWLACKYGVKCYQKNLRHLTNFVHPGDRNYRVGMVYFPTSRGVPMMPEFPTMRDLFNYCDPDESGNISEDEFRMAWEHLKAMPLDSFTNEAGLRGLDCSEAWSQAVAGGDDHLNFTEFARWAHSMKLKLPVGIDISAGAERACRFQYASGKRCPCAAFEPAEGSQFLCACGHKSSVHLSDCAFMSFADQEILTKLQHRATVKGGLHICRSKRPGVDMVTSQDTLDDLQALLTSTHKGTDNWTRDRGCSLHGRHACADACVFAHRAAVPSGFRLARAERNRNEPLWQTYITTRSAIKEECVNSTFPMESFTPASSARDIAESEPLDPSVNEWRVFHGTSLDAIRGICSSNFRLKMAGSGATWKDAGAKTGTPLYGYGVLLTLFGNVANDYRLAGNRPLGAIALLRARSSAGVSRRTDHEGG